MASVPVNNNVNALMNTVSQPINSGSVNNAALAKQEQIVKDSFDMVMNRINAQAAGAVSVQSVNAVNTKNMTAENTSDYARQEAAQKPSASKEAIKDTDNASVKAETKTVDKETVEKNEEAVKEAGEKMVEEVAKELDMTPEEVEAAMAVLGFDAAALLNPENLKQLLVVLSGNEDALSLVTDAELYLHLQNLFTVAEESLESLQEELGISEEELNALIADLSVAEDTTEQEAVLNSDTVPEETEQKALEGNKDYTVTVHKDGETVQVKVTVDDASGDAVSKENVTAVSKDMMQQEGKAGNRQHQSENKGEGNAAGSIQMQMPMQQAETVEAPQQTFTEHFVSTQDIMNQIVESMKINLRSDVQEMELQLHPASLGNINVQIASKDGMITAQFTAQNEMVKAAIESQLVQLKEQFEQQGIKVEAVEVTVANYQFEQSFSGKEEEQNSNNGSKKNTRRINLSELNPEELPEEMDDSERIAADMMAKSGNTVDYTA